MSRLKIDSIENGIVLDHIKAGNAMLIYNYLHLDELDCTVALIKNVKSKKRQKKDIIKIENNLNIDWDVLGFIDPNLTVNIIKDGKLMMKRHVQTPKEIQNVIRCHNPRCICSTEQNITHIFRRDEKNDTFRCIYCEQRAENPRENLIS